jgi:hypothetical protein
MSPKRYITHEGYTAPLNYWADKIGISKEALVQRLICGWTVAEAVTTAKHNRQGKRVRRKLARVIADDQPQAQVNRVTPLFPPLEELKRQHLATQRQFNSLLRQFNRDLHALMGRGVGLVIVENANDRTTPVARDLS